MADSTNQSQGSSSSQSSSNPVVINTPQSDWALQLSQLLGALTQNQYNWAQNEYNAGKAVTDQNIAQYMQLVNQGAGLAQNLLGRYENIFEPLMNKYIEAAGTYNSEARQRFMMGQAESTAAQADQAAMDSAQRQLQGYGVNPNSGRYEDLLQTSRLQDAATRAGAGTQASVNTANTGRQMLQQAAQFGQNIPGMTVNALQSAYTGLGGAENAVLGQLNTGANLFNTVPNFANAAANANKNPLTGQQSQSTSGSQQSSQGQSKDKQPQQQQQKQPGQGNQGGGGGGLAGNKGASSVDTTPYPDAAKAWTLYKQAQDPNQQDQFGAGAAPFTADMFNSGGPGGSSLYGDMGFNPLPYSSTPQDPATQAWATQNQGKPFGADPFNGSGSSPGAFGQGADTYGQLGQGGNQDLSNSNLAIQAGINDIGSNLGAGGPWDTSNGPQGGGNWWDPTTPAYGDTIPGAPGSPYPGDNPGGDLASQAGINDIGSNLDQFNNTDTSGGTDFSGGDVFPQDPFNGGDTSGGTDFSGGDVFPQDPFNGGDSGGGFFDNSGGGGGDYSGGYAAGGVIPNRTTGGPVPRGASPSGGRQTDDIPARLNANEFVIPRDVKEHYGTKYFTDLIAKSRKARTGMAGPPPQGKMKPALRMKPTFTSSYMGNR